MCSEEYFLVFLVQIRVVDGEDSERDRLYITEKASGLLRDGSVWLLLISLLSESC